MATFLCNSIWTLGSALVRNSLTHIYTFSLSTIWAEKLTHFMTVCDCVHDSPVLFFCTQETLPASPEATTPTPVSTVSQYACQRRTTTQNNNKIFTVGKCFSGLTLNHAFTCWATRGSSLLLCNVKSSPNLFCSNWMAGLLHSRALWHNSPPKYINLQMSSICSCGTFEVQQLTCLRTLARGLARTRPQALRYAEMGSGRDTPHKRWWICPFAIWCGRVKEGRTEGWVNWVAEEGFAQGPRQNGKVVNWSKCWWVWKEEGIRCCINNSNVAEGAESISQKTETSQCQQTLRLPNFVSYCRVERVWGSDPCLEKTSNLKSSRWGLLTSEQHCLTFCRLNNESKK